MIPYTTSRMISHKVWLCYANVLCKILHGPQFFSGSSPNSFPLCIRIFMILQLLHWLPLFPSPPLSLTLLSPSLLGRFDWITNSSPNEPCPSLMGSVFHIHPSLCLEHLLISQLCNLDTYSTEKPSLVILRPCSENTHTYSFQSI